MINSKEKQLVFGMASPRKVAGGALFFVALKVQAIGPSALVSIKDYQVRK